MPSGDEPLPAGEADASGDVRNGTAGTDVPGVGATTGACPLAGPVTGGCAGSGTFAPPVVEVSATGPPPPDDVLPAPDGTDVLGSNEPLDAVDGAAVNDPLSGLLSTTRVLLSPGRMATASAFPAASFATENLNVVPPASSEAAAFLLQS